MKCIDCNKERLRGLARQRDKYNSIVDGRYKPKKSAVEEMRRKPYGGSEEKKK